MSLVEQVKEIVERELDNTAKQIKNELIARIPVRTGRTRESIVIERESETSRFIGSYYEGLKYYDEGNSATGKNVAFVPMKNKQVNWDYGKRPYRPKNDVVYSRGRKGYSGKHIIKEVADLHR